MYNSCLVIMLSHSALCESTDLYLNAFSPNLQLTQGSGMDIEQGLTKVPLRRRMKFFGPLVSPIFLQAFSLTFLAEWGDRSQLTTIILGAREVCAITQKEVNGMFLPSLDESGEGEICRILKVMEAMSIIIWGGIPANMSSLP